MDATHFDDSEHLDAVLADYLRRTDRGGVAERSRFLNAHPEIAAELSEFFIGEDWLGDLIQRCRPIATE